MSVEEPLHPFVEPLYAAVDALPDSPARAALRAVLARHEPAHWYPEREWLTCSECAVLSWPPPAEPESMWSDVVYPCATVVEVAEALGVPVPEWCGAQDQVSKRITALIERSGLGTAEAVLLRASVPDDVAARVLERSRQFGAGERRRNDLGRLPAAVRAELWEAFAGGRDMPLLTGPGDEHWTAGVDRILTYLHQVGLLRTPGRAPTVRSTEH
jgi:hypothetical protein